MQLESVVEVEWTKVMSDDRLVKFTYLDLPEGKAFLTAQIAGHEVVYSVFCSTRTTHLVAKALNITSHMSVHHCQTDPRRLGRRSVRSTASTSCLMESAVVWRAGSPSCMRVRSSTSSLMRFKGAASETSGDGGTPRAF
jgi:hypothetical protein